MVGLGNLKATKHFAKVEVTKDVAVESVCYTSEMIWTGIFNFCGIATRDNAYMKQMILYWILVLQQ